MATDKQALAIQIYKANYGKGLSKYQIMRQAGYSHSAAKNPKVLTQSDDWQAAMDEFLPDHELLKTHNELLHAKKLESVSFPIWMPQEKIVEVIETAGCKIHHYETNMRTGEIHVWYFAPDAKTRGAALKLAYELKGKMKQKVELSTEDEGSFFGATSMTINVVNKAPDADS